MSIGNDKSAAPQIDVDTVLAEVRHIVAPERTGADRGNELARLETLVRAMARDGVQRDQPMREVLARIGDKWSSLLLHLLRTGNYRHAVLRRLVSAVGAEGRISQRMLTLRLRALERDGLLERRVVPGTHPPGVEYALTELGQSLTAQIEELLQWVRDHMAAILEARERFGPSVPGEGDGD
jgi:DNA-binding HxlR family transcriptional regulator